MKIVVVSVALLAAACAPKEPSLQEKHRDLYRAMRKIDAAIAIGVSYAQFGELLQDATTEILVARDRQPTGPEQTMVTGFGQALDIYHDSLKLWKAQIDTTVDDLKEHILLDATLIEMVQKYGLKPELKALYGRTWSVLPREGSIQAVWTKAEEKAKGARADYFNLDFGKKS